MRKEAEPTSNAHGRGDMPQTDKVSGEFMKPKAARVSEGVKNLSATREQYESSEWLQNRYGKLK